MSLQEKNSRENKFLSLKIISIYRTRDVVELTREHKAIILSFLFIC